MNIKTLLISIAFIILDIYRFYNRHVFMAMNFSFNRFPSPPEKENSIAIAIKGHRHGD